MRKIDKIVVHHSAVYQENIEKVIKSFNNNHKLRLYAKQGQPVGRTVGREYIAYHFIIGVNGVIKACRELDIIGYHASNYEVNETSIGICLVGDFDDGEPTEKQYTSLGKLIKQLRQYYGQMSIHGHNEFVKNKTCPGKNFIFEKIIMELYKKIYKEENPNGGKIIKDVNGAIERLKNSDGSVNIEELVYFISIGFERLGKK